MYRAGEEKETGAMSAGQGVCWVCICVCVRVGQPPHPMAICLTRYWASAVYWMPAKKQAREAERQRGGEGRGGHVLTCSLGQGSRSPSTRHHSGMGRSKERERLVHGYARPPGACCPSLGTRPLATGAESVAGRMEARSTSFRKQSCPCPFQSRGPPPPPPPSVIRQRPCQNDPQEAPGGGACALV